MRISFFWGLRLRQISNIVSFFLPVCPWLLTISYPAPCNVSMISSIFRPSFNNATSVGKLISAGAQVASSINVPCFLVLLVLQLACRYCLCQMGCHGHHLFLFSNFSTDDVIINFRQHLRSTASETNTSYWIQMVFMGKLFQPIKTANKDFLKWPQPFLHQIIAAFLL